MSYRIQPFFVRCLSFSLFLIFVVATPYSLQSQCPSGDIIITNQMEIDSFQLAYPNCRVLQSNLFIEESMSNDIQSLLGLNQIIGIKGSLTISNNIGLLENDGFDSLLFVDDFIQVSANSNLIDIGFNHLYRIGNGLSIINNNQLIHLSSLQKLHHINGPLNVSNNPILSDISGLENIYPESLQTSSTSLADLNIYNNPQLDACQIRLVCEVLSSGIHSLQIHSNGQECVDSVSIAKNCNSMNNVYCVDTLYGPYNQYTDHFSFGEYGLLEENWSAVSCRSYYGGMLFDDVHFYRRDSIDQWELIQVYESSYGYDSNIDDMASSKDAMIISTYEESIGTYNGVKILEPNNDYTSWSVSYSLFYDIYGVSLPPIDVAIDSNYAAFSRSDTIRVIEKSGNSWAPSFEFMTPSGSQVEMSGNFIISSDPSSGTNSVAASIYERSGNNWNFSQFLELPGQIAINGDVEIENNELIIRNASLGIHIFRLINNNWVYGSQIPTPQNSIIQEACIYQNNAFISGLDTNTTTYKAFYFRSKNNTWLLIDSFTDFTPVSSPTQDCTFGYSMALTQNKCLITDLYEDFYFNHNPIYPFGDFVILNCLDYEVVYSNDPCPEGSIELTKQSQIDSFLILYPNCAQISGDLNIKEGPTSSIWDISGMSNIVYINGDVIIQKNKVLNSISELSSLSYVNGKFTIFDNDSLVDISLPSLASVAGEFSVVQNQRLVSIKNQPLFRHIDATLNCYNNINLQDISGLALLDPTYIQSDNPLRDDYEIHGNTELSSCSIYTTCLGLSDGFHTADIRDNAQGCNTKEEILGNCLPIVLGQQCPSVLNLNGIIIEEGRYKAAQTVKSNNSINGSFWVIYEAANDIELNHGFEIELGTEFQTIMKPCVIE